MAELSDHNDFEFLRLPQLSAWHGAEPRRIEQYISGAFEEFEKHIYHQADGQRGGKAYKPTLLIASPDPTALARLSFQLGDDYCLLTADSGEAAWKILVTGNVDLLLLDIDLNGCTAFELLSRRQSRPQIKRIPVLLSADSVQSGEAGLLHGADDYVLPASGAATVRTRAANVLAQSRMVNHRLLMELSRMHRRNEALRERAEYDELTGLYNRAAAISAIAAHIPTAAENVKSALLVLDLDGFKSVNDTYGHLKGDELLREFAAFLRAAVRITDVVGRIGGDEFVIYMNGLREHENAERKCAQIISRTPDISSRLAISKDISVSIGITEITPTMHSYEDAFRPADIALYRAKQMGKNRFVRAETP